MMWRMFDNPGFEGLEMGTELLKVRSRAIVGLHRKRVLPAVKFLT